MNPNPSPRNTVRLLLVVFTTLALTTNVSAQWKEKVLYSFQGGSDGVTPVGGVVFDKLGNLYGATSAGGTICPSPGCGTVFEVSPPSEKGGTWKETAVPSGGCTGISVENLTLDGQGQSINGVSNAFSQDSSYVNHAGAVFRLSRNLG
jgi:uncharacterized repeat protein (TIGR03803 family)